MVPSAVQNDLSSVNFVIVLHTLTVHMVRAKYMFTLRLTYSQRSVSGLFFLLEVLLGMVPSPVALFLAMGFRTVHHQLIGNVRYEFPGPAFAHSDSITVPSNHIGEESTRHGACSGAIVDEGHHLPGYVFMFFAIRDQVVTSGNENLT